MVVKDDYDDDDDDYEFDDDDDDEVDDDDDGDDDDTDADLFSNGREGWTHGVSNLQQMYPVIMI